MTDDQLINKYVDGNVNAFNTLVWRWEKSVYNFILRYVGNREESKDICQKTFVRAYLSLHRLRDRSKFSTWLYQIAVNLCRDELKKRNRHNTSSLDALLENKNGVEPPIDGQAPIFPPDRAVQIGDLQDWLNRALQAIPEEQRVVIVMKEYQGLKFSEIADILETSTNTAKSRMYYGLRALRKVLEQWNVNKETLSYEV